MKLIILYECGTCGQLHPWGWNGDCRDDRNRYATPLDAAEALGVSEFGIEIRPMEDRAAADARGEP